MSEILSDGTHTCRKPKRCNQCGRLVEVGQRYRKQVFADGGLQTYRAHEDCDKAASEYMDMSNWDPRYDDAVNLCEAICPEDRPWLTEKYPAVAARLFPTGTSAEQNSQKEKIDGGLSA